MATLHTYHDSPAGVPVVSGQVRSAASIIAILCAIGSFVLSAQNHGFFALLAALVAIGAGMIGGLRALSPRVSGGIFSILAVTLGLLAIIVALLVIVF